MRVFIETMGCRTNAADSSQLATFLRQQGITLVPSPDQADWVLLNSCTVTHKADRDTGKTLRRYKALPNAPKTLILGCLPSATPDHSVLALADAVVPGWDVAAIGDLLTQSPKGSPVADHDPALPNSQWPLPDFELERLQGMTRVNIKICQGCDGHCTYCIVPTARGKPESYSTSRVLQQVRMAHQAGFQEIILSGTHLLKYGKDLSPPSDLLQLMRQLPDAAPGTRFRFGSVEPDALLEPLLDVMASSPVWCRHLHVAVQHSSDAILASMGRTYRFDSVKSMLQKAAERVPGITLGMDFIVGFPGETDALFQEALQNLHDLPFAYMHVFAFSSRPGTVAANWLSRAPEPPVVKARSATLRALSRSRRKEALERCIGQPVQVLLEQPCTGKEGYMLGHTDHYFDVAVPAPVDSAGKLVRCVATRIEGEMLIADGGLLEP